MKCRKLFSLLLLCAALLLCALAPAGAASLSEIDCIYATTPHTLLPVGEEIAFTLHYDGAAALGDYEITAEFLRKPIDDTGRTYTFHALGTVSGNTVTITLSQEGRYLLQLTLKDADGNTDTLFAGYYVTDCSAVSPLEQALADIKAQCLAAGADSTIEKARFAHDYIISSAVYSTSAARKDDPEGVLLDGAGVCQSYAYAYQMIMKELGVECLLIDGKMGGEDHVWNLIKVNGNWYHVDCTADDPVGGSEGDGYFMISDDVCSSSHSWNTSRYPTCGHTLDEAGKTMKKDGFTFNAGYGNITIQSYTGTAADLVIPAEIDGRKVVSVAKYFLQNNSHVKTLTFSEGIARISSLFAGHCENLISVSIPSTASLPTSEGGVVSGLGGFVDHCNNLRTVTVANGNPYLCVADNVLYNKAMTTLLFYPPQSRTTVIHVPDGVSAIQDDAFAGNTYLKEVVLPDSVTKIGYWAFSNCSALEKINIPDNCAFIGQYAFHETKLSEIHIPAATESISPGSLPGTLTSITVDSGNPKYYAEDNVLFHRNGVLLRYAGGTKITSYAVPAGVNKISMNAFYGAVNLKKITLPQGLVFIDYGAFYRCENLTEIAIPDTVETIEQSAFMDCTHLVKLTIPASVTSIGSGILNNVKGPVIYGEKGSEAEAWAARNGYAFQPMNEPWDVSGTLGDSIAWTLSEKGVLTLTGTGKMASGLPEPWAGYANNIKRIVVSDGITSVASQSFYILNNVTTVTLADSVTSIGEFAFYSCDRLKKIAIPSSVTRISEGAFYYCPNLVISCTEGSAAEQYALSHSIPCTLGSEEDPFVLPAALTAIEEEAFCGSAMEQVTIPEGVTSIGARAFADCTELALIAIPDSVKEIADDAFAGSENVSILCSEGSYAHGYAAANGVAYSIE